MAKVQISINDELLARVDKVADVNYQSRSGLMSTALTQYLNQQDMLLAVQQVSYAFKKIAENNSLDDESLKMLEDFERISRIISGR